MFATMFANSSPPYAMHQAFCRGSIQRPNTCSAFGPGSQWKSHLPSLIHNKNFMTKVPQDQMKKGLDGRQKDLVMTHNKEMKEQQQPRHHVILEKRIYPHSNKLYAYLSPLFFHKSFPHCHIKSSMKRPK